MKILFVCSGNIHRSALAEAFLKDLARRDGRTDVAAASAGMIAVEGMEAAREAAALAGRAGLDLSAHRSRPVTAPAIASCDEIVVMERAHREWLARHDAAAGSRCRLLSEFAGPVCAAAGVGPGDDIPDAIGEDEASFRRSFVIVEECVQRLYRALPPAPQEVYAQAIEERFRALRRTPLTLSPADFGLIESWWERGVPLWIVLESFDHLFRRREASGGPGRVRRLGFCRDDVEERFASYERTRATMAPGGPASGPDPGGAEELLRGAAERLLASAKEARGRGLQEAADLFERVARETGSPGPEPIAGPSAARLRLHALEEDLLSRLHALAGEETLAALREQAAEQLEEHRDRMTAAAFQSTVSRLVTENLRRLYGAPDLSRD